MGVDGSSHRTDLFDPALFAWLSDDTISQLSNGLFPALNATLAYDANDRLKNQTLCKCRGRSAVQRRSANCREPRSLADLLSKRPVI